MEKELKNYKSNLLILFICYIIVILLNMHLFFMGSFIHLLYGLAMVVLCGLVLYCLILFNKDIIASVKIAVIIGPIMSLLSFLEGYFGYRENFIINFRFGCLVMFVGGILIFNTARKLNNNS